jgi:hypothetical protein
MSQVLGKLLLVLEAQTSGFQKGLQDAKRMSFDSAEGMIDSFKRVAEQLGKLKFSNDKELKRSFEIVGGVAAATAIGIVAATAAITKSTAMQAAEMSKLAQSYGLSIEAVSAFRVASKLTDVSMETLTIGMGKLAKSAGQVAQTGQSTGGAFKTLGVAVSDGQGHLRPMADLLLDVSDKMSKLGDGTGKTVLAQQLFGKSGAAMIPFLNRGKEGIKEMMELSDQLGLTWSEKDAKAAEQLKDQIEILELRGTAFKENYAKGVIPALNQISDAFTRADKTGGSFAKTLGETIGAALKKIVGWAYDAAIGFDIMFLKLQKLGTSKFGSAIAGTGEWRHRRVCHWVEYRRSRRRRYRPGCSDRRADGSSARSSRHLNGSSTFGGGGGGTGKIPSLAGCGRGPIEGARRSSRKDAHAHEHGRARSHRDDAVEPREASSAADRFPYGAS